MLWHMCGRRCQWVLLVMVTAAETQSDDDMSDRSEVTYREDGD